MIRTHLSTIFIIALTFSISSSVFATPVSDKEAIEKTAMNYIEGFYEGDESKLKAVLQTDLQKFGFWKGKDSDEYKFAGQMTFEKAIAMANDVKAKKNFAKPDAPKKVELINSTNKIAIVKVTAYWGVDYMMLSKNNDKWMIAQILWEGPSAEASPSVSDMKGVERAGLNYIEGFYEGDSSKLTASLDPKMYKFGYGFDRKKGAYREGGRMTYEKAIGYADDVKAKKKFAKPDAPKKVEVLGVMNKIAAVKITAWWGVDYMLLSKDGEKWSIKQILWASLPPK